jgi:hypothetical protein
MSTQLDFYSFWGLIASTDEEAPVNNARQTITDLKAGKIPQTVVRDLGDAVKQATRDSAVGGSIGRTFTGGIGRS